MSRNKIVYLWISQFGAVALNTIAQVVLAILLDVKAYGNLITLITLTNILISIGSYGLGQYNLSFLVKDSEDKALKLKKSFVILLIAQLFLLAFLFILRFLNILGETISHLIIFYYFIIFSSSILSFNLSLYQSINDYFSYGLKYLLNHTYRILGLILPAIFIKNLTGISVMYFIIGIILTYIYIKDMKHFIKNRDLEFLEDKNLKLNFQEIKNHFNEVNPFAMTTILFLLYQNLNVVLINIFVNPESAANYFLAFSILSVIYLIPNTLFSIYFLPKIHKFDDKSIKRFVSKQILNMLVLGILFSLIYIFIGFIVSNTVIGNKYHGIFDIMKFLAVVIPIKFVSSVYGGIFNLNTYITYKVRIQLLMTIVNLIINIILLPKIGIIGTVISLVISECIFLILSILGFYRKESIR